MTYLNRHKYSTMALKCIQTREAHQKRPVSAKIMLRPEIHYQKICTKRNPIFKFDRIESYLYIQRQIKIFKSQFVDDNVLRQFYLSFHYFNILIKHFLRWRSKIQFSVVHRGCRSKEKTANNLSEARFEISLMCRKFY
jgi:hypothetical protein